jgi:hypothetical protein
MSDFLKNVIKEVGNEYASLASDGIEAGDSKLSIEWVCVWWSSIK